MYADIPEWKDYAKWWGTAALALLALGGIVGGLAYLIHIV